MRNIEEAAIRRTEIFQGVAERAQSSCHLNHHRAFFSGLVDGLAAQSRPSSRAEVSARGLQSTNVKLVAGSNSARALTASNTTNATHATHLLNYNRTLGYSHKLDNLPMHMRRFRANRSTAHERTLQQELVPPATNAGSRSSPCPKSSIASQHSDLPPGVPPWAVVTPGRVAKPTPQHARFVAAGVQHRTRQACRALQATPTMPNHNAVRRTFLAQDVTVFVGVIHTIDEKVLRPEDEDMVAPLSLQTTISDAVQAPYSLFSGPPAPSSTSVRTSGYISSWGDTEYSKNGDTATTLPKLPGHAPEDDASANESVLTSDSTVKTSPQKQSRSTSGPTTDSYQKAETSSARSRDSCSHDGIEAANGAVAPVLRKSAFGCTLPFGRSPSSPKGRAGRLNLPESSSHSAGRSSLRSAGTRGVSFDLSGTSHSHQSGITGARPSTVQ